MHAGQRTHHSLSDTSSWKAPRVPPLVGSSQEGLRGLLLALGVRRRPAPDRAGLAGPREVPRETGKEGGRDLRSPPC